jgi:hypothetical protein
MSASGIFSQNPEGTMELARGYPLDGPLRPGEIKSCIEGLKHAELCKHRLEFVMSNCLQDAPAADVLKLGEVVAAFSATKQETKAERKKAGKKTGKKERKVKIESIANNSSEEEEEHKEELRMANLPNGAKVKYNHVEYYFQRRSGGRCYVYRQREDVGHPTRAEHCPMITKVHPVWEPRSQWSL